MATLVAILLVLGLGLLAFMRWRSVGEPAPGLGDATREERIAARRLGFAPKPEQDPLEAVGDPRLAAMGVVAAMAEIDGPLDADETDQLVVEAQVTFDIDKPLADSLVIVALWLLQRSSDRMDLIARLAALVAAKAGGGAAPDLLRMAAAAATFAGPADREAEAALEVIRQAFGVNA
ncbi:MAG: hypothetical protein AAGC92_12295 [Pseudomonadota bacterium]